MVEYALILANVAGTTFKTVGMNVESWASGITSGVQWGALTYALVAWSFLVELIGSIVTTDHWLLDASLLHHIAPAPSADPRWSSWALMASSRSAGVTGANPKPQLPMATDVTPCQPESVQYGSQRICAS